MNLYFEDVLRKVYAQYPGTYNKEFFRYRATSYNLQELNELWRSKNKIIGKELIHRVFDQIYSDFMYHERFLASQDEIRAFFIFYELNYHLNKENNYIYQPVYKYNIVEYQIARKRGHIKREINDDGTMSYYNVSMNALLLCRVCKLRNIQMYLDCGCIQCAICTYDSLSGKRCLHCKEKICEMDTLK